MIDSADAGSAAAVSLLTPADHANTAAATGEWTAFTGKEGHAIFTQHVGVVTAGSVAGKIQTATDDQGTGVADVATFATTVTTSNDNPNVQKAVVDCRAILGYVRYLGTITTGPAVVGCTMLVSPKSV